jgi:signal recognition particle subunit SRP54
VFDDLTGKLEGIFSRLRGRGKLTEDNIRESLREVRRALLEADVHFTVAKDFVARVEARAIGREVLGSLSPGQQVVGIVHDEMVQLLGGGASGIAQSPKPPTVIFVVGLQGGGKTTFSGKLAVWLTHKGKHPMLAAADLQRPAAIDQLAILGEQARIPVVRPEPGATDPVPGVEAAVNAARKSGRDYLIVDTAGRLHIDDEMMQQLARLKKAVPPHEVLLVVDGMIGQDAVQVAETFHRQIGTDGVVLTKMDGDARGGAALSVRQVTGRPIKFLSTGEKLDQLEVFHPDRLASRILGMGDVVTLVERAQGAVDAERAAEIEKKLRKAQFTLEDFLAQLREVKKMGPLDELLGMIPGMGSAMKKSGAAVDDGQLTRVEAIIQSMTPHERRKPVIIDGSRRKRIARGSGTTVQDVNRLLRDFEQMSKMMRALSGSGGRGRTVARLLGGRR